MKKSSSVAVSTEGAEAKVIVLNSTPVAELESQPETAPAQEPSPTAMPEPSPVLSVAQLVADRTEKVQQMLTISAQIARLERSRTDLGRLVQMVEQDDERQYQTLMIADDHGQKWSTNNATLSRLLVGEVSRILEEKVSEKQSELLSITL
jgi:hypothetical protein